MAMAGLCLAQHAAGLAVSVLATFRDGTGRDLADNLERQGVKVTLIGPAQGGLARHPQLTPALRDAVASVDVVHAHGLWEEIQFQAARAATAAGKPYVITPHGMLTPWSLGQKRLKKSIYLAFRLKRVLNHAAAIHYTTAHERDQSASVGLKPPAIVEPLGVDLSEFQNLPARGAFRAKHNLADRKLIVFLGRIHPGKGVEYLVPALAKMKRTDAMLAVVGPDSGGFQRTIERMIEEHQLQQRVIFTGMLRDRDKIEALVDADVFALPSEHENFGLVVIESLACGTPVVVSDGVAIAGEVKQARAGSVVHLNVPDSLSSALDGWLDDTGRNEAGERGRAYVFEHFDWTTIGRHWVEHYGQLSKGRPS